VIPVRARHRIASRRVVGALRANSIRAIALKGPHPTNLDANMPARYPDEPLHHEQMSLADLNARCSALEHEDQYFIEHILAGRTRDEEDEPRRVFVNARQGVSAPAEGEYTLQRDYDSAFGLSQDLPFTSALAIFPMSNPKETLTKDNHLKVSVTIEVGRVFCSCSYLKRCSDCVFAG
jgi:hypothetical protein